MKNAEISENDDLRAEYDLKTLRVRKLGPERERFIDKTIHLEPDVADIFPDSQVVNEALRFLIRVTRKNSRLSNPHISA